MTYYWRIELSFPELFAFSVYVDSFYDVVRSERRKGYGTQAVQLTVDYLFLSIDVARIEALTDMRNKASQKVLEKAGFKREGTLRRRIHQRSQG